MEDEGLEVKGLLADESLKDLSCALSFDLKIEKTQEFKTCTGAFTERVKEVRKGLI